MENIQTRNVGNRGDILKHAALVQLALVYADTTVPNSIVYLDTHAYLLQSRLANTNWQQETQTFLNKYPAYQEYYNIETPYVQSGNYLCSGGLINACLPESYKILCENHQVTRRLLKQQLNERDLHSVVVFNDVSEMGMNLEKNDASLLILVDPFCLSKEIWQTSLAAIDVLSGPKSNGLLLVFTYDKYSNCITWPEAPKNWLGPIARITHAPYFLAVYTTDSMKFAVQKRLIKLGWQLAGQ